MCVVSAAVASCLVHGCAREPQYDAEPKRPDAAVDAGASNDAIAVSESGPPSTALFPEDQWLPLKGLPSECANYVAKPRANAVPRLQWSDCTPGRSGCRRSAPLQKGFSINVYDESLRPVMGEMSFISVRWDVDSLLKRTRYIVAVERLDGTTVLATGADSRVSKCLTGVNAGNDGIGLRALLGAGSTSHFFAVARQESPDRPDWRTVSFEEWGIANGEGPSATAFGDDTMYVTIPTPLSTGLYRFDTGKVILPGAPGQRPRVALAVAVAGGAITQEFNAGFPAALSYVSRDGVVSRISNITGAQEFAGFAVDRARNDDMVWLEVTSSGEPQPSQLWTAPFTTDAAGFKPRKVALDSAQGNVVLAAHGGYALFVNSTTTARLVRLSDGAGWLLQADPGTGFRFAAGLTDDEAWIFYNEGTELTSRGVMRFRLDALGPPTVPSGL